MNFSISGWSLLRITILAARRVLPPDLMTPAKDASRGQNGDPAAARATTRAIVSTLIEQSAIMSRKHGEEAASMAVLDPASLPSRPVGPNRMRLIGGGKRGGRPQG